MAKWPEGVSSADMDAVMGWSLAIVAIALIFAVTVVSTSFITRPKK
ncbi:hypothetical protein ACWCSD_41645 [Nonomuraea sp. NPDC001684]